MGLQPPPVLLLQLRQLDRFLKRQGLHSAARTASVNWEAIKLTTLEKLQELLHLRPGLECSLRTRQPQCTSMPSEIVPLGLRGSKRHQRKRVDSKPARELALFFQQKRLSSIPETGHSGDSGVSSATLLQPKKLKGLSIFPHQQPTQVESVRDHKMLIAQQPFDPSECFKRPQVAGDVSEPGEIST